VTVAGCLIASGATLRIEAVDESGKPAWVRLEVHDSAGKLHQASGSIPSGRPGRPDTGSPYLRSFVVNGQSELDVPPGRYRIVAEHGLEYERLEQTVELGPQGQRVRLGLKPWIRMRDRGWWSGDMHVHRPMENVPALLQAEDLNLGVVFTMWNRQNLWTGKTLPHDPVQRVTDRHWMTVMNAEDERGGGAWMLHHLREPLKLENVVPEGKPVTESWFPPGIEFVRKARAQRHRELFPWFDSEKPIWWEVPVMMALEPPDSIGLAHNHYNQYGMYGNEAWGRPRDTQAFPDIQGFSDYSLSLIYRYWNLGMLVPPSAGSASGVLPNPVGYNRMYARIEGAFSIEKWYQAVRDGRVFVTNGPVLFFDTKMGRVEALAREVIERVEIVANGRVVKTLPGGSRRVRGDVNLNLPAHNWVAARCFLRTAGTVRLAHTAPVRVSGRWDARLDARYFIEWIDKLIEQSRGSQREKLLPLYQEARKFYEARSH